ncbi:enhanced serine sensitivity protein SseB C-terminal domain-containing protein [Isoalcanivorax beigongshangi]|uniref:Enhanced serine sensitivity protein SseB C-terminal domain-containing protein n=1 Tax=Isoalcanivorax beigongshangi TaxID=3238810 RepID=A0ABV4AJS4_9GAMM
MSERPDLLEQALIAAVDDADARPRFYQCLLDADVYVLMRGQGDTASLVHWGREQGGAVVPLFSSLSLLQQAVTGAADYLRLPALELFARTEGLDLVLNPGASHSKELLADEVRALQAGRLGGVQRRDQHAADLRLGQPEHMPELFLNAVRRLLIDEKSVQRAWFALLREQDEAEPAYLIGLETRADFDALAQRVGPEAAEHLPDGRDLDLVPVVPGEPGPAAYFLTEPGALFFDRAQVRAQLQGLFPDAD